jgi:hypothetical protein
MNSWDKADSNYYPGQDYSCSVSLGPNDKKLLKNLAYAGPDHGKFLRMITVSLDITAPLYWWKEFDTYKVGTVANSCSTMHKIHAKEFEMSDFSYEHLQGMSLEVLELLIKELNARRTEYNWCNTDSKKIYWWQMIQLLPTSYNQRRTVLLNYQVLKTMYHARRSHKLDEWRDFCSWIETLPYSELITNE